MSRDEDRQRAILTLSAEELAEALGPDRLKEALEKTKPPEPPKPAPKPDGSWIACRRCPGCRDIAPDTCLAEVCRHCGHGFSRDHQFRYGASNAYRRWTDGHVETTWSRRKFPKKEAAKEELAVGTPVGLPVVKTIVPRRPLTWWDHLCIAFLGDRAKK